jgi:hypothetical protein
MRQFQDLSDATRMQLAIKVLHDSGTDASGQSQIIEALVNGYLIFDSNRDDEDEARYIRGLDSVYKEMCKILDLFCTVVYCDKGQKYIAEVASLDEELSTHAIEWFDHLAARLGGTRYTDPFPFCWGFNDIGMGLAFARLLGQRR